MRSYIAVSLADVGVETAGLQRSGDETSTVVEMEQLRQQFKTLFTFRKGMW